MPNWLNYPQWYVVQTKPQQELRANSNLNSFGVKTFFPQVVTKHGGKNGSKQKCQTKPLFPRYLFVNFNATEMLQKIKYTRGIQKIVSYGDLPCIVDEELIKVIKAHREDDGYIHLEKDIIKPGDRVLINKPHFHDFVGIFEHETKDKDRVSILLTTVSYQVHVILNKDDLQKIDNSKNYKGYMKILIFIGFVAIQNSIMEAFKSFLSFM